jgi:serine/threonine protein kinase
MFSSPTAKLRARGEDPQGAPQKTELGSAFSGGLSAINHEHVVRIYDRDSATDGLCGGALGGGGREVDRDCRGMGPFALCRRRAAQPRSSCDIVHRGIKPRTSCCAAEGVLVLTVGVAKRTERREHHQGEVLGTPHYISPEQAQAGNVGPSADLYSLGVIFYEMLTGKRAFTGETILEILSQHIIAPIPRLPAELEDYQPLIDGLLAATAKVHGLTLVTRNVADIARTGVSLLDPFAA